MKKKASQQQWSAFESAAMNIADDIPDFPLDPPEESMRIEPEFERDHSNIDYERSVTDGLCRHLRKLNITIAKLARFAKEQV